MRKYPLKYPKVKKDLRRKVGAAELDAMEFLWRRGYRYARIGTALGLDKTTVRYHLQAAYREKQLRGRKERERALVGKARARRKRFKRIVSRRRWRRRYYSEPEFRKWRHGVSKYYRRTRKQTGGIK